MFANDTKCLKRIKESADSFAMQLDLNNLSDLSKAFNLSFNQNKFVHLHFIFWSDTTSPDTDTGVQNYYIDGTKIAFHNSTKDLGLIITITLLLKPIKFWVCSAPYAYIGPYAYGTSHMRILIWDAHTRMGQHFVPYEYLFACFISLQVFGYCWYK